MTYSYTCVAGECELVRIAVALVEHFVTPLVFEQLRSPDMMGEMVPASSAPKPTGRPRKGRPAVTTLSLARQFSCVATPTS